jgi:hypothetical protein
MKVTHLTEEEMQQYVLDKAGCEQPVVEHMEHCAVCQATAAAYHTLFEGIKEEPKAVFDFNVTELVMSQLPQPAPKASTDRLFTWILVIAMTVTFGAAGYWLREDLAFLFNNISNMVTALLVTAIAVIAVCQGIDMYRRYQQKMHALDLY